MSPATDPVILAVDSATASCSCALWQAGAVRARGFAPMAHGQAEALVPMVQATAKDAGVALTDIDLVAVTVGPGAFTGLRIGLATARGLAMAAGVPCFGITTTEAVAAAVQPVPRHLLVALDTRRADVYAQSFTDGVADGEPAAVPYDGLADFLGPVDGGSVVVAGDKAADAAEALMDAGIAAQAADADVLPDAAQVARLAAERWQPGGVVAPARPLYLKPPQATLPKNGGRLRP